MFTVAVTFNFIFRFNIQIVQVRWVLYLERCSVTLLNTDNFAEACNIEFQSEVI